MGREQLEAEIIQRSVARTWAAARAEWTLAEVYFASEPDRCLCGQFPIIELCVLRNRLNHGEAIVGNVCVRKFLQLPSDRIFAGLKRIQVDPKRALNEEAIQYAYSRRWINRWELQFSLDTKRKRSLSERQMMTRRQINEKVLAHVAGDARPRQAGR